MLVMSQHFFPRNISHFSHSSKRKASQVQLQTLPAKHAAIPASNLYLFNSSVDKTLLCCVRHYNNCCCNYCNYCKEMGLIFHCFQHYTVDNCIYLFYHADCGYIFILKFSILAVAFVATAGAHIGWRT